MDGTTIGGAVSTGLPSEEAAPPWRPWRRSAVDNLADIKDRSLLKRYGADRFYWVRPVITVRNRFPSHGPFRNEFGGPCADASQLVAVEWVPEEGEFYRKGFRAEGVELGLDTEERVCRAVRYLACEYGTVTSQRIDKQLERMDKQMEQLSKLYREMDDPPAQVDLVTEAQERISPGGEAIRLKVGSDLEIAKAIGTHLPEIVFAENAFWRFGRSQWDRVAPADLQRVTHLYDGAQFSTGANSHGTVKLNKARIASVLAILSTLLARPDFFADAERGVNLQNGFLKVGTGGAELSPHSPDQRARHTLPGRWAPSQMEVGLQGPPPGSLLHRLLSGVFKCDPDYQEKITFLQELAGAVLTGDGAALKKAVILWGPTAGNGKSQVLDLFRGLAPNSATASIPAARLADDRFVIELAGKLLNAADELSASAIGSDAFKSAVTGEPMTGRGVYQPAVTFRPRALHLFATNVLPAFTGGMDRGVRRRLAVISCNRVIPPSEQVEGIGRRIVAEESDLVTAWAVAGALRRQRNGGKFTIPSSSEEALNSWLLSVDPVVAWLAAEVTAEAGSKVQTRVAYERFREWARMEGFSEKALPEANGFTQRVTASDPRMRTFRRTEGRYFMSMSLRETDEGIIGAEFGSH